MDSIKTLEELEKWQEEQEVQTGTIQDYQLTNDMERRDIRAPHKLG